MSLDHATASLHQATGGSILVDVGGAIDLATVDVLTDILDRAADKQPTAIVVDLKHVTFFDSTAINALMTAYRRARSESIVFTVVNCPAIVVRVMRVLGIHDLLTGGDENRG